MSLLNFSVNQSFIHGNHLTYQAVEESFNLKNEEDMQSFNIKLDDKQKLVENEINQFDEKFSSLDDFKVFYDETNEKINDVEEIQKNIMKNPDLVGGLSNDCIINKLVKIKKIKESLLSRKVNQNQLNTSSSILKTSFYDNVANVTITKLEQPQNDYDNDDEDTKLVNNHVEVKTESTKSDDNQDKNYKYIEEENSIDRQERVKGVENKFDYINLICQDQNNMADDQTDFIKGINKNYDDGVCNTKNASDKLSKWYEYKEKKGRRNCVMLLFIVIIMVQTINYFKMRIN